MRSVHKASKNGDDEMKCVYRANMDCRMPRRNDDSRMTCQLCLIGQLCDETGLNTSAIMEISFKKIEEKVMEGVYKEEYE